MAQSLVKKAPREIHARPMAFAFPADMKAEYVEGDPYATQLMNALSLTFPEGERFFVASVRGLRDHVKDPVLSEQVKGFLAQESFHRREHHAFNQWLITQGIDAEKLDGEIRELLSIPEQNATPLRKLAVTCALEHFTAIMAEMLLTTPSLRERIDQNVRALWTWHAIEELDHKAVAFDVYRAAGGGYFLRVVVMLGTSVLFIAKVSQMQARLLAKSGDYARIGTLLKGAWRFWRPGGYFTRLVPAYLRYFHPRFHPLDTDESELIRHFERALAREALPVTVPDETSSNDVLASGIRPSMVPST